MTLKRVFLAALVAGGMIGSAAADDMERPTGFYLSGGGGANFLDRDTIPNILGATGNHNISYESGWLGIGALGYKFDETLRIEVELGYRDNNIQGVSNLPVGPTLVTNSSDVTAFSQLVNVIFDIPISERVDVSVGGGVGGALVDAQIAIPGTVALNDDQYGFAYQALAGLTYQLFPRWQAVAEYRYFATAGSDLDASLVPLEVELDYDSHAAVVGLRYFFNAPAAPAPAPIPVAQDIGPWIVFFDFDKSNIRPDAAATISTAVAQAQEAETLRFRVTGHTDTVGSSAYNDALSLRRAEAVKAELIRLGVPADEIVISGAGFGDPLVSTGPGVREQQNRRAVIEIP